MTGDRPDPALLDRVLRFYVNCARVDLDGRRRVVEYLEVYGVPAAAGVADRHDLVWTTPGTWDVAYRKLKKMKGAAAVAGRRLLAMWRYKGNQVPSTLGFDGVLIPIAAGGRLVSAKVYRPPQEVDGKARRGKFCLRGMTTRYLWGADDVPAARRIYVVEGEGDKIALDGYFMTHWSAPAPAVVATGGIAVVADAERCETIRSWRRAGKRVFIMSDPKEHERRAAADLAAATGAQVYFSDVDPRDLVGRMTAKEAASKPPHSGVLSPVTPAV